MRDEGHEAVERLIKQVSKRIAKEYGAASKRAEKQLKESLKEWERERKRKSEQLYHEMTRKGVTWEERHRLQREFMEWRDRTLREEEARQGLVDKLAYEMLDADRIAREMVAGRTAEAFTENCDWATFQIEKAMGKTVESFTLYDQATVANLLANDPELYPRPSLDVQKAWKWDEGRLSSLIAQAVLSGDSIDRMMLDVRKLFAMNARDAERVCRTAMTGAENAGRVESYKRAQGMSIKVRQQWMATLDERTRESHRQLDGETVAVGAVFSNGCRYPGDPTAEPGQVYNCRCTLVASVEGEGMDLSDIGQRWKMLPEGMTYAEWKAAKAKRRGGLVTAEDDAD